MTVVRDKPGSAGGEAAPGAGRPRRLRWLLPALGIVLFLLAGGPLMALAGKTSEVQSNDSSVFLPASAEATAVNTLNKGFIGGESLPGLVVYERESGLTPADLAKIQADTARIAERLGGQLVAPPTGPITSQDGKAAQVVVQFAGSDPEKLRGDIGWIREQVGGTAGLTAHVTGPAGLLADLLDAFSGINGILLAVTGGVVLLILIAVYRSPILPFVVLGVAGVALGLANGVVYLLAKADVVKLSGQTQGILDVLVLGAGTDYALLLVSRFREELRRHPSRYDAMRAAWRAAVEPILASGGTVILGLLCLLVSDLASNRSLGPVGAIGIGCALLAMLGLLPAILVLLGRAAFWPFRPGYGSPPAEERGLWARLAGVVGRRARLVWVGTALVLTALALGVLRFESSGIPQSEQFITTVDSEVGQAALGRHFPAGSGTPVIIIANADRLPEVAAAAQGVPGVAAVVPYAPAAGPPAADAQPPSPRQPKIVDGKARLDVTLQAEADTPEAFRAIRDLRAATHPVAGADAKVGGFTAINMDVQDTSRRDRSVIIPLVLLVVFGVLTVLLRAIVAPLLLVGTVILSFLATLGVSALVFHSILDAPRTDAAFPLFAFVFLVALGVDYNIFLMTRVREEVARRGNRAGTLVALAVTGGVITSAGVVLAATFAALSVLPLVFLVQLAFTVAFGVLLDTLVVRSLLVPALTIDVGPRVWWPGRLRKIAR